MALPCDVPTGWVKKMPAHTLVPRAACSVYIDPLRECYEAFVIYQFFEYLVAYLEDEYGDIAGVCASIFFSARHPASATFASRG